MPSTRRIQHTGDGVGHVPLSAGRLLGAAESGLQPSQLNPTRARH